MLWPRFGTAKPPSRFIDPGSLESGGGVIPLQCERAAGLPCKPAIMVAQLCRIPDRKPAPYDSQKKAAAARIARKSDPRIRAASHDEADRCLHMTQGATGLFFIASKPRFSAANHNDRPRHSRAIDPGPSNHQTASHQHRRWLKGEIGAAQMTMTNATAAPQGSPVTPALRPARTEIRQLKSLLHVFDHLCA